MSTKTKLLFTLLVYGALSRGYSQTVAPSILNAGGSWAVANGITFELNFGEMLAVSTVSGNNVIVTQGVLQPVDNTAILPVTLIRFSGVKMNGYNKLEWVTGHESGSTQMALQRSDDAIIFTTIYQTPARGIANGSTYSYNDSLPFHSKVFYRLRITEAGGAVRYSSIVVLYDFEKSYWTVYPNPVPRGSMLQVTLQNADAATNAILTMLDASGRKVYEKGQRLVTGFQTISLPVQLPAGLYTLSVTGFGKSSSQKIIVK